jgi:hypothetical protein
MADTIQPFVAVSGLAVGITATTVIGDSASIPVAVCSFNGLTGAVAGVASFNGLTGAVTGVASFNGSTGDVIGVGSVQGMTGAVTLPGLNLYLYSIGII